MAASVSSKTLKTCGRIRPGGKRTHAVRERGGSLIEFTMVMPVLLLVMTGMVSFGFAIHNDLVLTNAVNGAAQVLAFSRGQTTDPCATAYTAISSAAPSLATNLYLTFVINGTTYAGTTTCTAGASNMVQGATAQITASYAYIPAVLGRNFPAGYLKSQTAEIIQ